MKKSEALKLVLRVVVGAVFAVTGYLKLLEPQANFTAAILSYQIVSARIASLTAQVLPWAELILGVFLILGLWRRVAFYGLWMMNTVFIVAISSALFRKIPIRDCGCFGEGSHAWPIQWTLGLDIALFAVFLFLKVKGKGSVKAP